jgi:3-deoxy-D-manno-octulosonate 8-phosphate phosphatase (KDO 8-P phosphatase)
MSNLERPFHFRLTSSSAESNLEKMPAELRTSLGSVTLLWLDVDGVLTDGSRVLNERGRAFISFSARDGLGIMLLQHAGVEVAFASTIESPIVEARARELGVTQVWLGISDKMKLVNAARRFTEGNYLFVGDDLWDLAAMKACDVAASVCDAVPEVSAAADVVSTFAGGSGAVRQIADVVLAAKGIDPTQLVSKL